MDCNSKFNLFFFFFRLVCRNKICSQKEQEDVPFVDLIGESCFSSFDCKRFEDNGLEFPLDSLVCYKNKCIPPQPEGAGCESSEDCVAGLTTEERQRGGCNEETRRCEIAREEVVLGGDCYADW